MAEPLVHCVTCGSREMVFSLERRKRKTLAIEVHPDGSVRVKAPLRLPLHQIRERVEQREGWIVKQQRRFAELPPPLPEREYVSGESYCYLGRQVRLMVIAGKLEAVKLRGSTLEVTLADPSETDRVRLLVQRWFRARAEEVFHERLAHCCNQVAPLGIAHPGTFTVRRMRRRWGSCSADGRILLNTQLVGASLSCIDYVIIHELCHVQQHNHSRAFYALLSAALPDWRERKRKLDDTLSGVTF